jgi:magnesium-protoporphyrin IX monomethyl ester (oxidative) cyclase
MLARGQTNFVRMLWKFNSVYNAKRQVADHERPVKYEMRLPTVVADRKQIAAERLFVIQPAAHAYSGSR